MKGKFSQKHVVWIQKKFYQKEQRSKMFLSSLLMNKTGLCLF